MALKRLYRAVREAFKGKPLKVRSSRWEAVRNAFLAQHEACAACGDAVDLQVHHIKPFHLYPELELDPDNLIVLCEGKGNNHCHLNIGHLGNWKRENPNVVADAQKHRSGKLSENTLYIGTGDIHK